MPPLSPLRSSGGYLCPLPPPRWHTGPDEHPTGESERLRPGGCPDIHCWWPATFQTRQAAIKNLVRATRIPRTHRARRQCLWFSLLSSTLHLAAPWYACGESTQPTARVCAEILPSPALPGHMVKFSAVVAHSLGLAVYTSCMQPACS